MILSMFLPSRFGISEDTPTEARASLANRKITQILQSLSHKAATHPVFTILGAAILASTTYLGVAESGLFERQTSSSAAGRVDIHDLLAGSKNLFVGADTQWRWQSEGSWYPHEADEHTALITLVFPDGQSSSQSAPKPHNVPVPSNTSAKILPSSSTLLASESHDSTIALSIPYSQVTDFLQATQEIPLAREAAQSRSAQASSGREEKRWIMKAVKHNGENGIRGWAQDAWNAFLDLLRNAETFDIVIMALGYLSMHLTFLSLFQSMRRLGSKIWLATMVLFSSIFAFFFGLIVTTRLGTPLTMVLLSEGLPFLVVVVGFEKPIVLTKALLAASIDRKKYEASQKEKKDKRGKKQTLPTVQWAVQTAVKERGFEIVRDYFIEMIILLAGAASPVQGGLKPFCLLAFWILFFDCILLFTFYTAVLTVKLEINRIKRHVATRKALEDDGVNRKVAEKVASSNDDLLGEKNGKSSHSEDNPFFGTKIRNSSIRKFKAVMLTIFALINLVNLVTIPFRSTSSPFMFDKLSGAVAPALDPFKVAGDGLEALLLSAHKAHRSEMVTVFAPINYELTYPSVHYSPEGKVGFLGGEYTDQLFDGVPAKTLESLLKSFEDPILSKWIVVALVVSLVMNGYLFNAARWTIKEPAPRDEPARPSEVMDQIAPQKEPKNNHSLMAPPLLPSKKSEAELQRLLASRSELELSRLQQPHTPDTDGAITPVNGIKRPLAECEAILKEKKARYLNDEELVELSLKGKIPGYALEKTLGDMTRAVKIRRAVVSRTHATRDTSTFLEHSELPYRHYDYERVHGACCENVIGYMPLPVGVAGPMLIDGQNYFIPMATTEGVLVASTSRGCKAINAGGGCITVLTGDGMTRGPCVGFETLARAGQAKVWLDSEEGQRTMKSAFNSTSRFARLQQMKTALAGTYLYIRFKTTTGDAMGMNMISKGVEHALHIMSTEAGFSDMAIISVSGNYCTDKKPAAINWIDGRGKSVVAEAIIPGDVVRTVLKSSVDALVELNVSKNLIGSAMAGSIGGFNAHAANIVTAVFLATGQDPAQNVESSNCITVMKNLHGNLQISVSMPSIEVGTIGGGTILSPQSAMLDLLGVKGAHPTSPGDNARQLARIVAAAVLAGELSLCSALAAGHLVRAHMSHNRSAAPSAAPSTVPSRAVTPAPQEGGGRNPMDGVTLTASTTPSSAAVIPNGGSSNSSSTSPASLGASPSSGTTASLARVPSSIGMPSALAMTQRERNGGR